MTTEGLTEFSYYRYHPDPAYRSWGRKYPCLPGIDECVRLIRAGKARGAWADIIAHELAEKANDCLPALVDTFRSDSSDHVRLYVMMALEIAGLQESVPFLAEALRGGDPRFTSYAERALRTINTREARTALWKASHPEPDTSPGDHV
jgi:hypothetical protein